MPPSALGVDLMSGGYEDGGRDELESKEDGSSVIVACREKRPRFKTGDRSFSVRAGVDAVALSCDGFKRSRVTREGEEEYGWE